jgi:hypothetical protein
VTSFTPQQKKDLEPLARRVREWNTALDDVSPDCVCRTRPDGRIDPKPGCPGSPRHCLATTLLAIRTTMNLVRMANQQLTDADLVDAVRALGRVFDGLPAATSHAAFANDILVALRGRPVFDENGDRR